ncbi:hypothetical protein [Brachybacterium paraconglomeratum]|uniref:hypothetical protein n=1 Tax=Brachybacterium paraconglomeratum TaxID=173362 RepID=UPI0022B05F95|nr:hypothetical protein [Brachybacterium paraconglomeratum]MCZ4327981.1 hypothetical protein [Brachybacterium paraconglomeratum]
MDRGIELLLAWVDPVFHLAKLLLLGLTASVLLRAVWLFFASWLPALANGRLRKIKRRIPAPFGSLHQVMLCLSAILLAGLLTAFPASGPWPAVMPSNAGSAPVTQMLTGAAALLALLTFGASKAAEVGTANLQGERYLGQVLTTYRYLHSPWTRFSQQPAFQVLVIYLFAAPLFLAFLPPTKVMNSFPGSPSLGSLTSALWCAAFALTGSVLIMQLVSSLRVTQFDAWQRRSVQRRIEWDLRDEAEEDWNEILGSRTRNEWSRSEVDGWVKHHIETMSELPLEQQKRYLDSTLHCRPLTNASHRHLEKACLRLTLANEAESTFTQRNHQNTRINLWKLASAAWRIERRRVRAERTVEILATVHRVLVLALIDILAATHVDAHEGADDERTELNRFLTRSVLNSAEEIDRMHHKLRLVGAKSLADRLLSPSAAVSDRPRSRVPQHFASSANSPRVLTLTTRAFRNIAHIAYSSTPHGAASTVDQSLRGLIEEAKNIRHQPTKDIVISDLITEFLRGVVIDGRTIQDSDDLKQLRNLGRTPNASTTNREIAGLIEQEAFSQLVSNGMLPPTTVTELLAYLSDWRIPCALLHDLLYARRSCRELSVKTLASYADARSNVPRSEIDNLETVEKYALSVLRGAGSQTGHFTTNTGISWLIRSLREPLTPDLCLEFERRRQKMEIQELRTLEFIQWHFVAGGRLGASVRSNENSALTELEQAAPSLWKFCHSWETKDRYRASELRLWLRNVVGPPPRRDRSSAYTWSTRTQFGGEVL